MSYSIRMTNTQKVTHKTDCQRVFSRYDMTCPRCYQLANGAAPRRGWGATKKMFDAQHLAAVRAHDCKASNCGPVCTFGEW